MKLSEISIHRPVFATVMSLVVTLVGLVGYSRLSVREYPNIDPPVVTVTTDYPGASAAIVETQVTKVLEDSLSGIEGIDYPPRSAARKRARSPFASSSSGIPMMPPPTCATAPHG